MIKHTAIVWATIGVLAFALAPEGYATADMDQRVAILQAPIATASVGWAVSKWDPLAGLWVASAPGTISGRIGWRIGMQVGGLLGGIGGAVFGGALGGF